MKNLMSSLVQRLTSSDTQSDSLADTRLLVKDKVGGEEIADIVKALASDDSVKTLQLPSIPFEDSGSYCNFTYLTQTLESNCTLTCLTLRVIPTDGAWTALCHGLQANQNIQHLTLGDPRDVQPRKLSATACYALGNVLQTNSILEALTLHSFCVTHEKRLARGLRQNRTLRKLELRHVEIQGLTLILSALRDVPLESLSCADMDFELKSSCLRSCDFALPSTLTTFSLTESIVNASDLQKVCSALSKSNVQHCSLGGNDLMPESLSSLKLLDDLRHVDLEENVIGNQGVEIVSRDLHGTLETLNLKANSITEVTFTHPFPILKSLDFSDNKIGDKGAIEIGRLAKAGYFPSLRTLGMDFCWITDKGMEALVEGLDGCPRLSELGLGNNMLGTAGAIAVRQFVEGSRIKTLDLSSCHITDATVRELLHFSSVPISLKEVYLSFNDFGNDGVGAIASFLRVEGCELRTLSIQFNHFDCQGVNDILNALEECNTSLQEFFYWTSRCGQLHQDNHRHIDHWLALNRAGRRLIQSDKDDTIAASLWPLILERAHQAYGANGVFHLLKEKPLIVTRHQHTE